MSGVKLTEIELKAHLNEQLGFLRTNCKAFDVGEINEAKRIAVILRVLLHDTGLSNSLLGQLNLKNIEFFSTTHGIYNGDLLTQACLLSIMVSNEGSRYIVPFEDRPPHQFKWMSFDNWWKQEIFVDNKRRKISRMKLITFVANQDGGAHVDPELDEVYYDLSRRNSITWVDGNNNPLGPNPALLSIRQIAFEVIKTLNRHGIDIQE